MENVVARRIVGSVIATFLVFFAGSIVVLLARILSDAFVPLILISIAIGTAVFIIDAILAGLSSPEE